MIEPYLKWAGSKRRMRETLLPLIAERIAEGGTYFEPFLGAGAVALAVDERHPIVVSDALVDLIETWQTVRASPSFVAARLVKLGVTHSREQYLSVRANHSPSARVATERASRFIYLNKTGFNGLYRVNKGGEFNVPMGRGRATSLPTLTELLVVARRTRDWAIVASDFEHVVDEAMAGDCVFADPPYDGTHDYSSGFDADDRHRLSVCLERAASRGVGVVVTDVWSARLTYAWMRCAQSSERRSISADVTRRGDAECMIGVHP